MKDATLLSKQCEICGKLASSGNNVSHSHRKTNRIFKPNLQKVSVQIWGKKTQVLACARCIKSL